MEDRVVRRNTMRDNCRANLEEMESFYAGENGDFSKLIRIERARASCVLSCVYVTVRITGSACQGWD